MKLKIFSLALLSLFGLLAAFAAESQSTTSQAVQPCAASASAACPQGMPANCDPEACPTTGPDCPPCCKLKGTAAAQAKSACSANKTAVKAKKASTATKPKVNTK